MRVMLKELFKENGFFQLHDNDWLIKQRIAGKIAAKALNNLETLVKNKTNYSLIELSNISENLITEAGGTPTFKGYKGFPASVCISINKQLVHGIPTDYHLQDGDIVKFDLGVTYEGAIVDTAITCIYGTPKHDWHIKIINATYEALDKGIAAIAVDKKLGVIGNAIYKSAKGNGFSVITKYGGHGISSDKDGNGILHANPFIENKSEINVGIRFQEGFSIAIEPLLVGGNSTKTYIDKYGAVCCEDICAHFEHTVYVHKNYVEIITAR